MNDQKGVTLIELLAVVTLTMLLIGVLFGVNQMIQTGFQDTSNRYQDDLQLRKLSELLTTHISEPIELILSKNQLVYKSYDQNNLPELIQKKLVLDGDQLFFSSMDGSNQIKIADHIKKISFIINGKEQEAFNPNLVIKDGVIQMKVVFQYEDMEKNFVYSIKILKDK